jgi:hypothetical protein
MQKIPKGIIINNGRKLKKEYIDLLKTKFTALRLGIGKFKSGFMSRTGKV